MAFVVTVAWSSSEQSRHRLLRLRFEPNASPRRDRDVRSRGRIMSTCPLSVYALLLFPIRSLSSQ